MSGSLPGVPDVDMAAAVLAGLSSPANVQPLPEYGILPSASIAAMNTIAGFIHDDYHGEGSLRLSFNATMRSWQEMGKKSIFLLPAIPLADGENLSMSFLDDSIVELWQLRGKPTSTTTFAMLVGLAGKGDQVFNTLAVGTRVTVKTPTYFLMAVEELEEVAMQQVAAWTTAEKRRLEDDHCGGLAGSHLDKRLRLGVQDD